MFEKYYKKISIKFHNIKIKTSNLNGAEAKPKNILVKKPKA